MFFSDYFLAFGRLLISPPTRTNLLILVEKAFRRNNWYVISLSGRIGLRCFIGFLVRNFANSRRFRAFFWLAGISGPRTTMATSIFERQYVFTRYTEILPKRQRADKPRHQLTDYQQRNARPSIAVTRYRCRNYPTTSTRFCPQHVTSSAIPNKVLKACMRLFKGF